MEIAGISSPITTATPAGHDIDTRNEAQRPDIKKSEYTPADDGKTLADVANTAAMKAVKSDPPETPKDTGDEKTELPKEDEPLSSELIARCASVNAANALLKHYNIDTKPAYDSLGSTGRMSVQKLAAWFKFNFEEDGEEEEANAGAVEKTEPPKEAIEAPDPDIAETEFEKCLLEVRSMVSGTLEEFNSAESGWKVVNAKINSMFASGEITEDQRDEFRMACRAVSTELKK